MRIALLSPLWKTVPPQKYGGSELVVANLAKGLSSLGHEVTTFACRGSKVDGELVEVLPAPMYELEGGFNWSGIRPREFLGYHELGKRVKSFDVVHNHMGIHTVALSSLLSIPMITTLHSSLPPDFPYLADAFRDASYVSISDAQRSLAPLLHYVATVYHGIDVASFAPRVSEQGKGFLFVGTLSRNKGVDIAVRTALALKKPLILAGEIREEDRPFLDETVFPYVDDSSIMFIGEVGHAEKNRLMRESDAVLFPSRWNEAFGLVMIESLACGTPVVALNTGSVSEVIRHGETGFVTDDEHSFIRAAAEIGSLSRESCRTEAETRFDLTIMSKSYESVYRAAAASYPRIS